MRWSKAIPTSANTVQGTLSSRSDGDPGGRSLTETLEACSQAGRRARLTTEDQLGKEIQECMLKCLDCRTMCLKLVEHYLRLEGAKSDGPDIRLLLNCSEICATTARFMLRGSEFCQRLSLLCAEVCKRCARQWSLLRDDALIEGCWLSWSQCAECCERTAGLTAGLH